jgi:hypothetical protein
VPVPSLISRGHKRWRQTRCCQSAVKDFSPLQTVSYTMCPISVSDSTQVKPHGLEQYEIDLESRSRRCWPSFLSYLSHKRRFDAQRFMAGCSEAGIVTAIIVVPNAIAIIMAYFFIYGNSFPLSSVAANLHFSRGSWIAYQVFLPLFSIAASFVDIALLFGLIEVVSRSVFLMGFATIAGSTPLWVPYVTDAALRKYHWNHDCDGFDGIVHLAAVHYGQQGLSQAQFPASLGGEEWQLWQSSQGVYQFAPVGTELGVSYNFHLETYDVNNSTTESGVLTNQDVPMEFPKFGLSSGSNWIRACYAPATLLKNVTGDVVIKTGLSAYTDCSKMKVCVNKDARMDAAFVVVGRIVIALDQAAACCTRGRYT